MKQLHILWTNDNIDTAHKMVFMYATNSMLRKWWDAIDLIVWGATAKLVAEDESIQEAIKKAQEAGVQVRACIACANQFGVTEKLESLGITVLSMGQPLTEIIQNNEKLITI